MIDSEDVLWLWDADCENAASIINEHALESNVDISKSVTVTAKTAAWVHDAHMRSSLERALELSRHPAYMDTADIEGATRYQIWSYITD